MPFLSSLKSVADALEFKVAGVRVDTLGRRWNPDLHPRDSKGRFIETGGVVRLWGGDLGKVKRALLGGKIEVEMSDGSTRRVPHQQVTMVRRPNGEKPTRDARKVVAEDEHRAKDPKRGDGAHLPDPGRDDVELPDTDPQDEDDDNEDPDDAPEVTEAYKPTRENARPGDWIALAADDKDGNPVYALAEVLEIDGKGRAATVRTPGSRFPKDRSALAGDGDGDTIIPREDLIDPKALEQDAWDEERGMRPMKGSEAEATIQKHTAPRQHPEDAKQGLAKEVRVDPTHLSVVHGGKPGLVKLPNGRVAGRISRDPNDGEKFIVRGPGGFKRSAKSWDSGRTMLAKHLTKLANEQVAIHNARVAGKDAPEAPKVSKKAGAGATTRVRTDDDKAGFLSKSGNLLAVSRDEGRGMDFYRKTDSDAQDGDMVSVGGQKFTHVGEGPLPEFRDSWVGSDQDHAEGADGQPVANAPEAAPVAAPEAPAAPEVNAPEPTPESAPESLPNPTVDPAVREQIAARVAKMSDRDLDRAAKDRGEGMGTARELAIAEQGRRRGIRQAQLADKPLTPDADRQSVTDQNVPADDPRRAESARSAVKRPADHQPTPASRQDSLIPDETPAAPKPSPLRADRDEHNAKTDELAERAKNAKTAKSLEAVKKAAERHGLLSKTSDRDENDNPRLLGDVIAERSRTLSAHAGTTEWDSDAVDVAMRKIEVRPGGRITRDGVDVGKLVRDPSRKGEVYVVTPDGKRLAGQNFGGKKAAGSNSSAAKIAMAGHLLGMPTHEWTPRKERNAAPNTADATPDAPAAAKPAAAPERPRTPAATDYAGDSTPEGAPDEQQRDVRPTSEGVLRDVPAEPSGGAGRPGEAVPDAGRADRPAGEGRGGDAGREGQPGRGVRAEARPVADRTPAGGGEGSGRDAVLPEPGAGDRGPRTSDGSGSRSDQGRVAEGVTAPVRKDVPRFRPTSQADLAPSGDLPKAKANVAAIETLRRIQAENRPATPEEQKVLARWGGWGAAWRVFDPQKYPEYQGLHDTLRSLLSDEEWRAAEKNSLNAHYTDASYVQTMWEAVKDLGFDGGNVLEPGSGSGTFIGFAPEGANMHGVELDPTSAAISRLLYPDADVRREGFQRTKVPDNSYDLTIGNVPFGDLPFIDQESNPQKHSLHNAVIVKSLRKTRPGGLVAVLTSHHTMDADGPSGTKARQEMADLGDLVGAVRLPSKAHSRAAGTDVVTDMLIFRKRKDGEPYGGIPFVESSKVQVTDAKGNAAETPINSYFQAHPENVLGDYRVGGLRANELQVLGNKDAGDDFKAAVSRTVDDARSGGLSATAGDPDTMNAPLDILDPDETAHEGMVREGKETFERVLTHNANGTAKAKPVKQTTTFTQIENGREVPFWVSKNQAAELRQLVKMRDLAKALLAQEAASDRDTAKVAAIRKQLNAAYDAYVKKHGPINRFTWARTGRIDPETGEEKMRRNAPQMGGFRDDPASALVYALEKFDPETQTASKASIFTTRTVAKREVATKATNPSDAVNLAMETDGEVRIPTVARILGVSEAEARKQLVGHVFTDHNDTDRLVPVSEYLSGNVRAKLKAARAAAEDNPDLLPNVAALETIVPEDLTAGEIDGRLGAAWVGEEDVQDFLREIFRDPSLKVAHPGGNVWGVEGRQSGVAVTDEWGTERMNAVKIAEKLLTGKPIVVEDTIKGGYGESDKRVVNKTETDAANAKAEEMQERFAAWLWEEPTRAQRLQDEYNDKFNGIVLREYETTPLALPGMSKRFTLRAHQNAAIRRIVAEPSALLAHEVGAGKTLEMVGGTMELRRLGLARKPAIVVPNHMLEQFSREFLEAYPNAKVLAAGTDDLTGDKRRRFVARAATGDWDSVILTQGAFQKLGMSKENQEAYLHGQLDMLRKQIARQEERGDRNSTTFKEMQKLLENREAKVQAKLDKLGDDAGVSFEETGIDYLMVDEAHMYKNLTRWSNRRDLAIEGSDKAADLDMKIRHLRERSESGRVVTFASATPIANSIGEAYTMQQYLRPDLLEESGIDDFDTWVSTFGTTVTEMEVAPTGGYRMKERFKKFRNVPELLKMFRVATDVKTADDLGLPVPTITNKGDAQNVIVPASEEFAEFNERALADMAEDDSPASVLKYITKVTQGSLDLRLVGEDGPPDKLRAAAEKIAAIHHRTKDREYPIDKKNPAAGMQPRKGSLQVVFSDTGTPNTDGRFTAYDGLRDMLVNEYGFDKDSIRYIHEANNDQKKAELFNDARSGKISVLIGSTAKMGVGTNVQDRAVALHHLDCPWRPADLAQRDGRVERQGNLNGPTSDFGNGEGIEFYRYMTEGSIDAYRWQTVKDKSVFIGQMMRGKLDVREIDDLSEQSMSLAVATAVAAGNPHLLEKARTDEEVKRLSRLDRKHSDSQRAMEGRILTTQGQIAGAFKTAKALDEAIGKRKDVSDNKFFIKVDGQGKFGKRAEGGEALSKALEKIGSERLMTGEGPQHTIGEFAGFPIIAQKVNRQGQGQKIVVSLEGVPGTESEVDAEVNKHTGGGVLTRLENRLAGLETRRDESVRRQESLKVELERIRERIGIESPYTEQLADAKKKSDLLADLIEAEENRDASEEFRRDTAAKAKAGLERLAEKEEAAKAKAPVKAHEDDTSGDVDGSTGTLTEDKIVQALEAAAKAAGVAPPRRPAAKRETPQERAPQTEERVTLTPDEVAAADLSPAPATTADTTPDAAPSRIPGVTESDVETYTNADCGDLALSLHAATGWPIAVVRDGHDEDDQPDFPGWVHAGVMTPEGQFLDVNGLHDPADVIDRWAPLADESLGDADLVEVDGDEFLRRKNGTPTDRSNGVAEAVLAHIGHDPAAEPDTTPEPTEVAGEQIEVAPEDVPAPERVTITPAEHAANLDGAGGDEPPTPDAPAAADEPADEPNPETDLPAYGQRVTLTDGRTLTMGEDSFAGIEATDEDGNRVTVDPDDMVGWKPYTEPREATLDGMQDLEPEAPEEAPTVRGGTGRPNVGRAPDTAADAQAMPFNDVESTPDAPTIGDAIAEQDAENATPAAPERPADVVRDLADLSDADLLSTSREKLDDALDKVRSAETQDRGTEDRRDLLTQAADAMQAAGEAIGTDDSSALGDRVTDAADELRRIRDNEKAPEADAPVSEPTDIGLTATTVSSTGGFEPAPFDASKYDENGMGKISRGNGYAGIDTALGDASLSKLPDGAWALTYPGANSPDDVFPTMRDGLAALRNHVASNYDPEADARTDALRAENDATAQDLVDRGILPADETPEVATPDPADAPTITRAEVHYGTPRVWVEPYRTTDRQGLPVEVTGFFQNGGLINSETIYVKKDGTLGQKAGGHVNAPQNVRDELARLAAPENHVSDRDVADEATTGADTDGERTIAPGPVSDEHADELDYEPKTPTQMEGEKYPLTTQQQKIADAVVADKSDTLVKAKAGTGKTSTLEAIARRMQEARPDDKIIYIAFNKSVQVEADGRMPSNVESRTGHSLAWQWAGKDLTDKRDRKDSLRRGDQIANFLGIRQNVGDMEPAQVAQAAIRTVDTYANSADDKISEKHLPDSLSELSGADKVRVLQYASKAWDDLRSNDGKINMSFDHIRKMWALSKPDLTQTGSGVNRKASVLFLDEAQDTPPVLAKVVADQKMQKVIVGDADQAIYGFTGAKDYLATAEHDVDLPLTKSWRFGPQVADWGNRFLQVLGSKERVEGGGPASKIVTDMDAPDAILVRSNGGMIGELLREQEAGRTVGVPKGTKADLRALVDSARYLMGEGPAPERMHEDLAPYLTWAEVKEEADKGDDQKLAMLVRIVDNFGTDELDRIVAGVREMDDSGLEGVRFRKHDHGLVATGPGTYNNREALKAAGFRFMAVPGEKITRGPNKGQPLKAWTAVGTPEQQQAAVDRVKASVAGGEPVDVIVSTAHKSKGLEWDRVRIGDDFKGPTENKLTGEMVMPPAEELRLAYVAVTRAGKELDLGSLGWVEGYSNPNGETDAPRAEAPQVDAPEVVEAPETVTVAPEDLPQVDGEPSLSIPEAPEAPAEVAPEVDTTSEVDVTPEAEAPEATETPAAPATPDTFEVPRDARDALPHERLPLKVYDGNTVVVDDPQTGGQFQGEVISQDRDFDQNVTRFQLLNRATREKRTVTVPHDTPITAWSKPRHAARLRPGSLATDRTDRLREERDDTAQSLAAMEIAPERNEQQIADAQAALDAFDAELALRDDLPTLDPETADMNEDGTLAVTDGRVPNRMGVRGYYHPDLMDLPAGVWLDVELGDGTVLEQVRGVHRKKKDEDREQFEHRDGSFTVLPRGVGITGAVVSVGQLDAPGEYVGDPRSLREGTRVETRVGSPAGGDAPVVGRLGYDADRVWVTDDHGDEHEVSRGVSPIWRATPEEPTGLEDADDIDLVDDETLPPAEREQRRRERRRRRRHRNNPFNNGLNNLNNGGNGLPNLPNMDQPPAAAPVAGAPIGDIPVDAGAAAGAAAAGAGDAGRRLRDLSEPELHDLYDRTDRALQEAIANNDEDARQARELELDALDAELAQRTDDALTAAAADAGDDEAADVAGTDVTPDVATDAPDAATTEAAPDWNGGNPQAQPSLGILPVSPTLLSELGYRLENAEMDHASSNGDVFENGQGFTVDGKKVSVHDKPAMLSLLDDMADILDDQLNDATGSERQRNRRLHQQVQRLAAQVRDLPDPAPAAAATDTPADNVDAPSVDAPETPAVDGAGAGRAVLADLYDQYRVDTPTDEPIPNLAEMQTLGALRDVGSTNPPAHLRYINDPELAAWLDNATPEQVEDLFNKVLEHTRANDDRGDRDWLAANWQSLVGETTPARDENFGKRLGDPIEVPGREPGSVTIIERLGGPRADQPVSRVMYRVEKRDGAWGVYGPMEQSPAEFMAGSKREALAWARDRANGIPDPDAVDETPETEERVTLAPEDIPEGIALPDTADITTPDGVDTTPEADEADTDTRPQPLVNGVLPLDGMELPTDTATGDYTPDQIDHLRENGTEVVANIGDGWQHGTFTRVNGDAYTFLPSSAANAGETIEVPRGDLHDLRVIGAGEIPGDETDPANLRPGTLVRGRDTDARKQVTGVLAGVTDDGRGLIRTSDGLTRRTTIGGTVRPIHGAYAPGREPNDTDATFAPELGVWTTTDDGNLAAAVPGEWAAGIRRNPDGSYSWSVQGVPGAGLGNDSGEAATLAEAKEAVADALMSMAIDTTAGEVTALPGDDANDRDRRSDELAALVASMKPEETAAEDTAEETAAAPDVQGATAAWVPTADLEAGDVAHVDGDNGNGAATPRTGHVLGTPEPVTVHTPGQDPKPGHRVTVGESPTGEGDRGTVLVPEESVAARAQRDEEAGDTANPTSAGESSILSGDVAESVPQGDNGLGVFPGSVVTDRSGRSGVVTETNAMGAQVRWTGKKRDETVRPGLLTVDPDQQFRPEGWNKAGQQVRPGHVVETPDGKVGTVESVAGDQIEVATPDGFEDHSAGDLKVVGQVTDGEQADTGYSDPYFDAPTTPEGQDVRPARPIRPDDLPEGTAGVHPNLRPEHLSALNDLGLDTDATSPYDVQQAALRLRHGLPVSPEQARKLAEHLDRQGAKRNLRKVVNRLNAAAARNGDPDADTQGSPEAPEPVYTPAAATLVKPVDLEPGDAIALPDPRGGEAEWGTVVTTRPTQNGQIMETTIELPNGDHVTRELVMDADVYRLPDLPEEQDTAAPAEAVDRVTEDRPFTEPRIAERVDDAGTALIDNAVSEGTPESLDELAEQVHTVVENHGDAADQHNADRRLDTSLENSGVDQDGQDLAAEAADAAKDDMREQVAEVLTNTADDFEPLPGESQADAAARWQKRMEGAAAAVDTDDLVERAFDRAKAIDNDDPASTPTPRQQAVARKKMQDALRADLFAFAEQLAALGDTENANTISQVAARLAGNPDAIHVTTALEALAMERTPSKIASMRARVKAMFARNRQRFLDVVKRMMGVGRKTKRSLRAAVAAARAEWRDDHRDLDGLVGDAAKHLSTGGDKPGPTVDPEPTSYPERVAAWRSQLPENPAEFGQQTKATPLFRGLTASVLRAGRPLPAETGKRLRLDRDHDGGPGSTATQHLAALNGLGAALDDEVHARVRATLPDLGDDPAGAVKEARRFADDLAREGRGDMTDDELWDMRAKAKADADDKAARYRNALADATLAVLAEQRPMGPNGAASLNIEGRGDDADEVKALRWAEKHLPTDWLASAGTVEAKAGRMTGYDPDGTLTVAPLGVSDRDGAGEYGASALHALAHHMEATVPGLKAAEWAHHWSKTSKGDRGRRKRRGKDALGRLKDLFPAVGVGHCEVSRPGSHPSPWHGQEHDGNQYESFALAMQEVFGGQDIDPDLRKFLMGVMGYMERDAR